MYFCSQIFKGNSCAKNAPTCYRAPRWPEPEFPRKIPEKYPPARNSGTPRKHPKNTEKIPKMRIFGNLGVFFRYFRGILGINSGSPEFRAGGIFSVFSWKFRVGPFRGSVAGRVGLNSCVSEGVRKARKLQRNEINLRAAPNASEVCSMGNI